MDATANATPNTSHKEFTSRRGALVWFFRKSRDRWKEKHHDLKATVKGLKNQLAALTKSRAAWRLKADEAFLRIAQLEAENAALRADSAPAEPKKKRTRAAAPTV